ncbi:hypothetical protein GCM10027059_49950 [Myceligenerans halotolerans]
MRFTDALAQAIDMWFEPGRHMVILVTCADDPQEHLTACQLWSTNPQGALVQRDDIAVTGKETRQDVVFAVVATGCSVDLTKDAEPLWREDARTPATHLLDVRRPMRGQR